MCSWFPKHSLGKCEHLGLGQPPTGAARGAARGAYTRSEMSIDALSTHLERPCGRGHLPAGAHTGAAGGAACGDLVRVSSNGTSLALRARVNRQLVAGAVRAAEEHVRDLDGAVEVSKT